MYLLSLYVFVRGCLPNSIGGGGKKPWTTPDDPQPTWIGWCPIELSTAWTLSCCDAGDSWPISVVLEGGGWGISRNFFLVFMGHVVPETDGRLMCVHWLSSDPRFVFYNDNTENNRIFKVISLEVCFMWGQEAPKQLVFQGPVKFRADSNGPRAVLGSLQSYSLHVSLLSDSIHNAHVMGLHAHLFHWHCFEGKIVLIYIGSASKSEF